MQKQEKEEEESINVCIRVRPLNEREKRNNEASVLKTLSGLNALTITDREGKPLAGSNAVFQYDHIFDQTCTTKEIYDAIASKIIRSTLDGINGTIFAYGQTSSGKTFTMQGDNESKGIISYTIDDIFRYIQESCHKDFLLRCSYVEIYNEVIHDLLASPSSDASKSNLKIREDPKKGIYIESTEEIITDFDTISQCLLKGEKRRTVGQTAMNEHSSRSHSIFRLIIESKEKTEDMNGVVLVASLNLVDLAGSESVRSTAAEGVRQREAGNINRSLLTLSRVINSLSQGQGHNAPYRDSKLTRLLQNSLGGNTRTLIVCCTTPSEKHLEETKSTLQFAARAKSIRTSVIVNEILDDQAQLRRLKKELFELRKLVERPGAEVSALKAENEALEVEKETQRKKIQKLTGLILHGKELELEQSNDMSLRRRQRIVRHRSKRHRETWCPGGDHSSSSSNSHNKNNQMVEDDDEDEEEEEDGMKNETKGGGKQKELEGSSTSVGSISRFFRNLFTSPNPQPRKQRRSYQDGLLSRNLHEEESGNPEVEGEEGGGEEMDASDNNSFKATNQALEVKGKPTSEAETDVVSRQRVEHLLQRLQSKRFQGMNAEEIQTLLKEWSFAPPPLDQLPHEEEEGQEMMYEDRLSSAYMARMALESELKSTCVDVAAAVGKEESSGVDDQYHLQVHHLHQRVESERTRGDQLEQMLEHLDRQREGLEDHCRRLKEQNEMLVEDFHRVCRARSDLSVKAVALEEMLEHVDDERSKQEVYIAQLEQRNETSLQATESVDEVEVGASSSSSMEEELKRQLKMYEERARAWEEERKVLLQEIEKKEAVEEEEEEKSECNGEDLNESTTGWSSSLDTDAETGRVDMQRRNIKRRNINVHSIEIESVNDIENVNNVDIEQEKAWLEERCCMLVEELESVKMAQNEMMMKSAMMEKNILSISSIPSVAAATAATTTATIDDEIRHETEAETETNLSPCSDSILAQETCFLAKERELFELREKEAAWEEEQYLLQEKVELLEEQLEELREINQRVAKTMNVVGSSSDHTKVAKTSTPFDCQVEHEIEIEIEEEMEIEHEIEHKIEHEDGKASRPFCVDGVAQTDDMEKEEEDTNKDEDDETFQELFKKYQDLFYAKEALALQVTELQTIQIQMENERYLAREEALANKEAAETGLKVGVSNEFREAMEAQACQVIELTERLETLQHASSLMDAENKTLWIQMVLHDVIEEVVEKVGGKESAMELEEFNSEDQASHPVLEVKDAKKEGEAVGDSAIHIQSALLAEKEELFAECHRLKQIIHEYTEDCEAMTRRFQETQTQLKTAEEEVERLETQRSEQVEDLRTSNELLVEKICVLQGELEELTKADTITREESERRIQEEKAALESQMEKLTLDLAAVQAMYASTVAELAHKKDAYQMTCDELAACQERLAQLEEQSKEAEEQTLRQDTMMEDMLKDMNVMEMTLQEKTLLVATLTDEQDSLQKTLAATIDEKNAWRISLKEIETLYATSMQTVKTLEEELLKKATATDEEQMASQAFSDLLEQERQQWMAEKLDLQTTVNGLKEEGDERRAYVELLEKDSIQLKDQLETAWMELQAMETKMHEKLLVIKNMATEKELLRQESELDRQQWQEEKNGLLQAREALQEAMENSDEKMNRLKHHIDTLEHQMASVPSQLEEKTVVIETLQTHLLALKEEKESLRSRLEQVEELCTNLQDTNDRLQDQLGRQCDEALHAIENKEAMEIRWQETQDAYETLKAQFNQAADAQEKEWKAQEKEWTAKEASWRQQEKDLRAFMADLQEKCCLWEEMEARFQAAEEVQQRGMEKLRLENESMSVTTYEQRNFISELEEKCAIVSAEFEKKGVAAMEWERKWATAQVEMERQQKRIEKLEAVKMTKETYDIFKQLKEENVKLKAAATAAAARSSTQPKEYEAERLLIQEKYAQQLEEMQGLLKYEKQTHQTTIKQLTELKEVLAVRSDECLSQKNLIEQWKEALEAKSESLENLKREKRQLMEEQAMALDDLKQEQLQEKSYLEKENLELHLEVKKLTKLVSDSNSDRSRNGNSASSSSSVSSSKNMTHLTQNLNYMHNQENIGMESRNRREEKISAAASASVIPSSKPLTFESEKNSNRSKTRTDSSSSTTATKDLPEEEENKDEDEKDKRADRMTARKVSLPSVSARVRKDEEQEEPSDCPQQ